MNRAKHKDDFNKKKIQQQKKQNQNIKIIDHWGEEKNPIFFKMEGQDKTKWHKMRNREKNVSVFHLQNIKKQFLIIKQIMNSNQANQNRNISEVIELTEAKVF